MHPTYVGNQARRVKEKRAFSFEGTKKKTIARVSIDSREKSLYLSGTINFCVVRKATSVLQSRLMRIENFEIALHSWFLIISEEKFFTYSLVIFSRFERNNISLV